MCDLQNHLNEMHKPSQAGEVTTRSNVLIDCAFHWVVATSTGQIILHPPIISSEISTSKDLGQKGSNELVCDDVLDSVEDKPYVRHPRAGAMTKIHMASCQAASDVRLHCFEVFAKDIACIPSIIDNRICLGHHTPFNVSNNKRLLLLLSGASLFDGKATT